jgi:hypothetical protein
MAVELASLVTDDEVRIFERGLQDVRRVAAVVKFIPSPDRRDAIRRIDAHHLVQAVEAVRPPIGDRLNGTSGAGPRYMSQSRPSGGAESAARAFPGKRFM